MPVWHFEQLGVIRVGVTCEIQYLVGSAIGKDFAKKRHHFASKAVAQLELSERFLREFLAVENNMPITHLHSIPRQPDQPHYETGLGTFEYYNLPSGRFLCSETEGRFRNHDIVSNEQRWRH